MLFSGHEDMSLHIYKSCSKSSRPDTDMVPEVSNGYDFSQVQSQ